MTRKLDIFTLLKATDHRDQGFYDRLDAEARKEFAPPVALRWASAVDDGPASDVALLLLNDRANIGFWEISDHPELQYRLIASSGVGKKLRHHWIAASRRGKTDRVRTFLGRFWPDASAAEMDILLGQFTGDSFRAFVDGSGAEPKEAKEIVDAYDQHVAAQDPSQPRRQAKRRAR